MTNQELARFYYLFNMGGGEAVESSSFTFEDGTLATDESGNTMITE